MPNIIIKPMRAGGDPLIEFTGSLGGESSALVESDGALNFSGPTKHVGGLSGSLQRLADGNPYLLAGGGVTLLTNSSGQVQISATGQPGGSDTYVQFNDGGSFGGDSGLTFDKNTDTLNVTNVIVAGDLTVNGTMTTINTTNLEVRDAIVGLGFASGSIEQVSGDRGLVMALDGEDNTAFLWKNLESEFVLARVNVSSTGTLPVPLTSYSNLHVENIQASIVTASLGFTGSLTKLVDGSDYLLPGAGITISTGSNGSVTITSTITQVSPASPDTGIQYNSGGSFAASSNFTYDGTGVFLTGTLSQGSQTVAFGQYSHATGIATIASGSGQNVVGKYNQRGNEDSLFVVGNGDDDADSRRSDIFLVNSGSVMVGSASIAADTFLYVGTKGDATNVRMDGNLVVSGTLDVKNGSDASVLSVNGSNVGIGTSSPTYKLEVVGDFAATTKSFVIEHPNKPGWKLRHGSLEGPENGVYVRGRTSGKEIVLPNYWKDLVDESSITVQITPVGSRFDFFVSSMDVNKVTVEFDADGVEYCYLVQASRKDEVFVVEFESK